MTDSECLIFVAAKIILIMAAKIPNTPNAPKAAQAVSPNDTNDVIIATI